MTRILFGLVTYIIFVSATNAMNSKTVESCESQHKSITELSSCLDIVKEATDRELQTWINNQTFILEEFALNTGRRTALDMFKRSQRNFNTYRENNCRWQYLYLSPDVKAAPAYKKCYILITKSRIDELSQIN
ncbi:lysozyme inhibitor LprI family protein [Thalassotalea marina]|uniref:Lysozyme inhibitor LprI-like N-terminal domain-containing protein n=1 Tax=Thalassotalea marina TaxID=1673741 RepID=A0A919BII5_9GAMM|nr:lysozyme inhibitor LprI family protein [Thalassotalea marina]GHF93404.1 hypothetical protein GCM10017161_22190 [Thalassotalea marina]